METKSAMSTAKTNAKESTMEDKSRRIFVDLNDSINWKQTISEVIANKKNLIDNASEVTFYFKYSSIYWQSPSSVVMEKTFWHEEVLRFRNSNLRFKIDEKLSDVILKNLSAIVMGICFNGYHASAHHRNCCYDTRCGISPEEYIECMIKTTPDWDANFSYGYPNSKPTTLSINGKIYATGRTYAEWKADKDAKKREEDAKKREEEERKAKIEAEKKAIEDAEQKAIEEEIRNLKAKDSYSHKELVRCYELDIISDDVFRKANKALLTIGSIVYDEGTECTVVYAVEDEFCYKTVNKDNGKLELYVEDYIVQFDDPSNTRFDIDGNIIDNTNMVKKSLQPDLNEVQNGLAGKEDSSSVITKENHKECMSTKGCGEKEEPIYPFVRKIIRMEKSILTKGLKGKDGSIVLFTLEEMNFIKAAFNGTYLFNVESLTESVADYLCHNISSREMDKEGRETLLSKLSALSVYSSRRLYNYIGLFWSRTPMEYLKWLECYYYQSLASPNNWE